MKIYLLIGMILFLVSQNISAQTKLPLQSEKSKTITGTVLAYHPIPCRRHQCSVWIIVRTKETTKEESNLVQMNVEYYSSPSMPNNGFPSALVESAKEWNFQVKRDVNADIAIPKYVKIVDAKTGEDRSNQSAMAAWIVLCGAEAEKLPFDKIIPAYIVQFDGYKRKG